ncbi:hypothetical protein PPL_00612 [Heterostelium album PN500]|uniref:NmrA-like domain-containing protein n=1 Tax=Heterostelium pallidum (strain ATCC 26659 / Pp 5 / PN500) TaxID=670386 RepID=D3AWY4_HETP5|nr:hypothetical protein PPL_00612 [Heterostelium album PN500]EFA86807.1 hypothetical protein PPL_00612 [Heterostelium album PN500]|eukprot:XP_020438910.1 hypothetical protein PPL_00612 [Heterostelium album PN500]
MSKKLVVVSQAFSKQGQSIINSLRNNGGYSIRALTSRTLDTPQALKLVESGVEVVQADLKDKNSLVSAFSGAYAAFVVRPAIPPVVPNFRDVEFAALKTQADAAQEANVQHAIVSMTDAPVDENGKTAIQKYIEDLPLKYVSTMYLQFFYSNLIEFTPPKKQEDGSFVFASPIEADIATPYVDPYTATGQVFVEFLENPAVYNRVALTVATESLTGPQIAETFQRVTGHKATYRVQTLEQYLEASGFNASPQYQYVGTVLYQHWVDSVKNPSVLKKNPPKLHSANQRTWEQFLQATKWQGESFQDFKEKNNY